MKNLFKSTISLFLIFAMLCSFAACGGSSSNPNPSQKEESSEQSSSAEQDQTADLKLTVDQLPAIDGATAMLPYYEEMVARLCGITTDEASKLVQCNTTSEAFPNLYYKNADLIFCAPPSEEQIAAAEAEGVTYESVQVLNSGFVFFVNKSNPVDNLTSQQLHDIYAGIITNWKEVGGNDEEIIAYQRSEGSGSQTGLYQHVISKDEIMDAPTELKIGYMSEIIDAVANYNNASGALGYSYYYYVTNMHYQEDVKLISIDGVYPSESTISYDIYPYISKTCAIFRSDEPEDSVVRKIAAWCSSSAGRQMSIDLGYVPSGDGKTIVKGYNSYTLGSTCYQCRTNNLNFEKISVEKTLSSDYSYDLQSYVVISGLKDKEIQQKINGEIKAVYDKYLDESYIPQGVNLDGLENAEGGERSVNIYVQFNCNNILSLYFNFYYSKQEGDNYYYASEYAPLTFDLNTGNQLALGDIFASKDNGFNYLNSKLYNKITENNLYEEGSEDYSSSLRLVKPFTGLAEDQKFYIAEDGKLWLIFDSATPEFYSEYTDTSQLEFDVRQIADFNKYTSSQSIFESDEIKYSFLAGDVESGTEYSSTPESFTELIGSRDIYISGHSSVCENLTQVQASYFGFDQSYLTGLLEQIVAAYDQATQKGGTYIYGSLSYSSYPLAVGNYTSVTKYIYAVVEYTLNGESKSVIIANETLSYNFKGESDKPMELADLFIVEADVDAIIREAMRKELEAYGGQLSLSTEQTEELIDYAASNIQSFTMNLLNVYLEVPGLIDYYKQLKNSDNTDDYYKYNNCLTFLTYENLGFSNLSIFE